MNYTRITLLAKLKELGFTPQPLSIVGIRSKADIPDAFDDKIYLITPTQYLGFDATTNPGVHWLKTFFSPGGTAVLKPGQYLYQVGIHRGYEALVQAAPVTIYRDTNQDSKSDEGGKEETGYFGINIHRAAQDHISKINDMWSAGCQVMCNPADFKLFMDTIKDYSAKSGVKKFPYYLIHEF